MIKIDVKHITAIYMDNLEIKIYFPGGFFHFVNYEDGPTGSTFLSMKQWEKINWDLNERFKDKAIIKVNHE